MNEKSPVASPERILAGIYRPLSIHDKNWYDKLAVEPLTARQLYGLNQLIDTGSEQIRGNTHSNTVEAIVYARQVFFEDVLGWGDEHHALYNTYQKIAARKEPLVPIDTVVGTQRILHKYDIDALHALKLNPQLLSQGPRSITQKIENLYSLGLDASRIVNASPILLNYSPDNVRAKVENLTASGLDAMRIIPMAPNILSLSQQSVLAKIQNFQALGLDATEVIHGSPNSLTFSIENIQAKVKNLSNLGLDAVSIVTAWPSTFSYSRESIQLKFALLHRYNVFDLHPELYDDTVFIVNILTTPLASLFSSLPHMQPEHLTKQLVDHADSFMAKQGATTEGERKEYVNEHVEELTTKVGRALAGRAFKYMGIKQELYTNDKTDH